MDKKTPVIEDIDDSEFKKTLFKLYKINKPPEILNFIDNNKFLKSLLVEAVHKIPAYFPDSSLYLDLFKDPESATGDHIVLAIATKLGASEALTKFDTLIRNWFSSVMHRAKGRLSLDVEFE